MTRRAALAAVVLIAACSGGTDTTAPSAVQHAASPADARATGQLDGIHDLIAAQSAAWAAKDAAAYAATYTTDAELVNPVGGILTGRAVVETQHAFLFNPVSGFFRSSTSIWAVRDIVFLTGATALVTLDVTLTGISILPPGLPAVEPGTVRSRVVWIAVKRGQNWEIMFQQMTPIPPAP